MPADVEFEEETHVFTAMDYSASRGSASNGAGDAGAAAWYAVEVLSPHRGETILVTGADRPLGFLAAQLVRLCGARVLAVCPRSWAGEVEGLGVEVIVDGPGLADRVTRAADVDRCLDCDERVSAHLARRLGIANGRVVCAVAAIVAEAGARGPAETARVDNLLDTLVGTGFLIPPAQVWDLAQAIGTPLACAWGDDPRRHVSGLLAKAVHMSFGRPLLRAGLIAVG